MKPKLTTLFIKNANVLVTMNDNRAEIENGALFIEDNQIVWVGSTAEFDLWLANNRPDLAQDGGQVGIDKTLDAGGCVVLPGLVNCHHHLYQTLTRTIGTGSGRNLFDWLKFLFPIWANLTPEGVYVSAKVALGELILSGATTVADHLVVNPNGVKVDHEIQAAQEIGVRFHPTRGGLNLGESQGGIASDDLCESEQEILKACVEAIETFHDPAPFSMLRMGVAPASLFTVTGNLLRECAALARQYPLVNLHTHLCETKDEEDYCLAVHGKRPVEYMESFGWYGEDVWFAHMVHLNQQEIKWLSKTNSGICHCPSSNMILASGIAPVREMIEQKVRVSLGLDGSASNDGNHLLNEARQAMLLQRVGWPGFVAQAGDFTARQALELATLGGARVLRRNDIGVLAPGKAADVIAFRIDGLAHAGAQSDPVAALLTCAPTQVWFSVINGQTLVEDGQFLPFEFGPVIEVHNRLSREMISKAGWI